MGPPWTARSALTPATVRGYTRPTMSSTTSGRPTQIGPKTQLSGNITGNGALTVEGEVQGDVRMEGALAIAPSGIIEGAVEAGELSVEGKIRGRVTAQKAHLGPNSQVSGRLAAPAISIHPRARVDAQLDMSLSLPRQVGSRR